jgi:hypothetical protein
MLTGCFICIRLEISPISIGEKTIVYAIAILEVSKEQSPSLIWSIALAELRS